MFDRLYPMMLCLSFAFGAACGDDDSAADGSDADAGDVAAEDVAVDGDGDVTEADGPDVEDDGGDAEADGDGGPARDLRATVLLGEGGFFGVSGVAVDGLVSGGGAAFAVGAHYAVVEGGTAEEPIHAGRVYLFAGDPLPGVVAEAVQVLEPADGVTHPEGGFGYALAAPCDIDGDGRLDLVVGNHLWGDTSMPAHGRVVVFYGSDAGGLDVGRSTTHLLSPVLRERSDVFGQTVLCADFDGDTFTDLLATGQNAGEHDTGVAAIFAGSAAGLPEHETTVLEPPVATVNRQYLGSATAWHDVDGDGERDLLVGGWGLIAGGRLSDPHTGGVLVYAGGTDWTAGPAATLGPGTTDEVQAGTSLAAFDAGGRTFVAVGVPGWVDGGTTGAVLVWTAGAPGFEAGLPQVLRPAAGTADVGFAQSLEFVPDYFGVGRGALLVGMKHGDCDASRTGTGVVAVFALGGDGVFAGEAELLCAPAPAVMDAFGGSITALGDLDGDGLRDFTIGMESHIEGDLETGVQTGGVVIYR